MISHLNEACCTSFCHRRLDSADQLFGKYCGIQQFQNVSLEKQSQEIIHPFTTWQKARSILSRTMNALFKFDDNNHTVYFHPCLTLILYSENWIEFKVFFNHSKVFFCKQGYSGFHAQSAKNLSHKWSVVSNNCGSCKH